MKIEISERGKWVPKTEEAHALNFGQLALIWDQFSFLKVVKDWNGSQMVEIILRLFFSKHVDAH